MLPRFLKICVADSAAAPERFDHGFTLPYEQVSSDTQPDFLRKEGLTPAKAEVAYALPVGLAQPGFQARLAA